MKYLFYKLSCGHEIFFQLLIMGTKFFCLSTINKKKPKLTLACGGGSYAAGCIIIRIKEGGSLQVRTDHG